jgi:hypothetical protein
MPTSTHSKQGSQSEIWHLKFGLKTWLLLFGVAIAFFGIVAIYAQLYVNIMPAGDSASYWAASRRLYFDGFQADMHRPYLFPLIIGLPFLANPAATDFVFYVQILNFLAWLATIWAIVRCLLFVVNDRWAFIGGLLFATQIGGIAINGQVMTEPIFTCCLAWAAYFCIKNQVLGRENDIFKAVGFITAATLIKPTVLPILFLFIVPVLIWLKIKGPLSIKGFFIAFSLILLPIGGQFYNMKRCVGTATFTYLSSENGYLFLLAYTHLLKETGSYTLASQNWGPETTMRRNTIKTAIAQGMDVKSATDSLCYQDLKKALSENPRLIIQSWGRAMLSNTKGESYFINKEPDNLTLGQKLLKGLSVVQNIFFTLLVFFNWLLAWLMPRKWLKYRGSYRIITTVALGIVMVSGLVFATGDRLHLPIGPLSIIGFPTLLFAWKGLFSKRH